jgi:hypothetical protein
MASLWALITTEGDSCQLQSLTKISNKERRLLETVIGEDLEPGCCGQTQCLVCKGVIEKILSIKTFEIEGEMETVNQPMFNLLLEKAQSIDARKHPKAPSSEEKKQKLLQKRRELRLKLTREERREYTSDRGKRTQAANIEHMKAELEELEDQLLALK